MSVIIRKVLFNPPEPVGEDFSLCPRLTETEGYESLPEIVAKCTAGIVPNARIKSKSEQVNSEVLNDIPVEQIYSAIVSESESLRNQEAGTNEPTGSENSGEPEPKTESTSIKEE